MRKLLIAILVLISSPVGSAEYLVLTQPACIIISKDGEIELQSRPRIISRLHYFLATKTETEHPEELAELLAATGHPRELAAIMKAESNGCEDVVGSCGELGPFQLMKNYRPAGYDRHNLKQNVDLAEMVLKEKIADQGGSLRKGVMAYNGSTAKSRKYRDKVLRIARLI